MPTLQSNGITIAYQTAGDPKAAPVLLVPGLGMQLSGWPEAFVDGLVELGFFVIRFDNRDCGLSTKFDEAGRPGPALTFLRSMLRWPRRSPYTLADMADDALGVLSALGVGKAHLVGASMGGAIAQALAAQHPGRVLSLTCIGTGGGRRGLAGASREARALLVRRPRNAQDLERQVEQTARTLRAIGSPAYPTPDKLLRQRVLQAIRRNVCAGGVERQLAALAAAGERGAELKAIRAPTLLIHGAADPLVPLACGADGARVIPGARLEVIEGMGHDLPAQLVERLLALIDAHAHGNMTLHSPPRLFEKQ